MPADWFLRTSDGGFIAEPEIQSCAVATRQLRALNVTSEKSSVNLNGRSIVTETPIATTCAGNASIGSSGFILWRPAVPVSFDSIHCIPLTPWCSSTTSQVALQIFGCSQGITGTLNTSSTVNLPGSLLSLSINSTGSVLAANESLLAWMNASSCQLPPPVFQIIVNYQTSQ